MSTEKHLWECDHPYYMSKGAWNDRAETHNDFECWADFYEAFGTADDDYNFLIRWDWIVGEGKGQNGVSKGAHELRIQFFAQRKSYCITCFTEVTPEDEPAVREYLLKRWAFTRLMWEPLS